MPFPELQQRQLEERNSRCGRRRNGKAVAELTCLLCSRTGQVGGTLFGEGDEMGQQWAAAIAEEQGEEAGGGGGALPSRYDPAGAVLGPGGFY